MHLASCIAFHLHFSSVDFIYITATTNGKLYTDKNNSTLAQSLAHFPLFYSLLYECLEAWQ